MVAMTMAEATAKLKARLQNPIQPPPMTEAQREEARRMRLLEEQKEQAALLARQREWIRYSTGLHWDEAEQLDWSALRPVNDGPKVAKAVAPVVERKHGLVYLGGSSGQAKTMILKIAVARCYRSGVAARYVDMRDVLQNLRSSFEKDYQRDELSQRMNAWIELPVLCLDELDKVNSTEWAKEQIFYLLDRRYSRAIREEALTIIASNQGSDELSTYLQSRMEDNRALNFELNAADARKVVPPGYRW